jgi:hypothetical protein
LAPRFGNFIGESTIGGRRLLVTSDRLRPYEVDVLDSAETGRLVRALRRQAA